MARRPTRSRKAERERRSAQRPESRRKSAASRSGSTSSTDTVPRASSSRRAANCAQRAASSISESCASTVSWFDRRRPSMRRDAFSYSPRHSKTSSWRRRRIVPCCCCATRAFIACCAFALATASPSRCAIAALRACSWAMRFWRDTRSSLRRRRSDDSVSPNAPSAPSCTPRPSASAWRCVDSWEQKRAAAAPLRSAATPSVDAPERSRIGTSSSRALRSVSSSLGSTEPSMAASLSKRRRRPGRSAEERRGARENGEPARPSFARRQYLAQVPGAPRGTSRTPAGPWFKTFKF